MSFFRLSAVLNIGYIVY